MTEVKTLRYFLVKYAIITTFNNFNAFTIHIHVTHIQYFLLQLGEKENKEVTFRSEI